MKKLLILLLLPIFIGGCYDYNELGDLAIISGIGIDYNNNNYEVTFEILSTKKEGEQGASTSTYTVSATGNTLANAFAANGLNMDKVPYYEHVEVVVIDEEIAKNHLRDISELLIRSSKLRNEFYMAVAKNITAKEIISSSSEEKPVASTFIVSMLEHSNNSNSSGYYVPFTKTLRNILTDGEDAIMSVLTLQDKNIILDGIAIYHDFMMKDILTPEEASFVNLLNNFDARTVFLEYNCPNNKGKVVASIYESKMEIAPNNNNVTIKGKINMRINEDTCGHNLKEEEVYQELEKKFSKELEHKLDNIIRIMKDAESNALSIGKSYYNKYYKDYYYLWLNQEFKYDFDLKINKKGLTFEVEK